MQHEHDLEQGRAARIPLLLDLGHNLLEGNRLVFLRGHDRGFQLRQVRVEAHCGRKPGAERHRVHEAADQPFQIMVVSAREHRTDHDVFLAARVTMQENVPGGGQHHEERFSVLPRQLLQCMGQFFSQRAPSRGTAPGLARGARKIGRKLKDGQGAGKLVFPIGQLALEVRRCRGIPLPLAVVRILYRPWRRCIGTPRGVAGRQIAQENTSGPAIKDGVVNHHAKTGVVFTVLEVQEFQQRAFFQREGFRGRDTQPLPRHVKEFSILLNRGQGYDLKGCREFRENYLMRLTARLHKNGPQNFVTIHYRIQGRAQPV